MIINDELYLNITIGSYTDFIQYSDLLLFRIVEHGGAGCVELTISFRTTNIEIKNLINSRNQIKIDIGPSKENFETYTVYPYEIDPNNDPSGSQYVITFTATPCYDFITDRSGQSYTGKSTDVINQICKRYFNKEAHIYVIPQEEECTWLRGFKTGAQYLADTWLHMYLGGTSCPIMYINKDLETYVYDLNDIKKQGATFKLVPYSVKGLSSPAYQYLNNFTIESYKYFTNEFTGFGDIANITNIHTGKDIITIPEDVPDLAATTEVEKALINATRQSDNLYQSDNTHSNYQLAYKWNVARLIRLNSIEAEVQIAGYHPEINILDIADVDAGDSMDSGYYIVDTKMLEFSYNSPILTTLALTRDNRNRVEDFDIKLKELKGLEIFKVLNETLAKTLQAIRNVRRLVVMGRQLFNGHFSMQSIKFLNSFKYGLLTNFSLFGATLDFSNSLSIVQSLKAAGNSLCNQLISAFIPYPYSYVLKNYALEHQSLKTMLSKLLVTFSPTNEFRALVEEITGLFSDLTQSASDIYESNYRVYTISEYTKSGYSTGTLTGIDGQSVNLPNSKGDDMNLANTQKQIQNITTEFIDNTGGVDIPIPQIDITESESLLPYDELRDLVADRTVEYLVQQGYLFGITNFKNILLGTEPMDFNTINRINQNIGNMLYARYWGTYKSIEEMTDFKINNSYKDIYVTVPTTKIIHARDNSKIFIAYPEKETDLIFYINNKEVEMDLIDKMDLGLYTTNGAHLYYNVYMSQEAFNSNSVVLEVRRIS